MAMSEKIRIALIKRKMNITTLSKELGCTSQNLSAKLSRDNFSEKELIKIAQILDCTFEGRLLDIKTGEELK